MGTRAVGLVSAPTSRPVRRNRLLSQLDDAQRQPLTLVVAPAGYGKTTLLSQWAEHTEQLVTWLTIAPHHNEPGCLVSDLRRMLGTGSPTTAVLDDFHEVTDAAVLDEVAALVEQLPPVHNLVVATRVDPPHRYYRMRLSDSLCELRAADLAFTCEEAAEFVERSAGEAPDPVQVDLLLARTEGWAAGIDIDGDDGRIDEYLALEVLDRQPEHIRQFLLTTSVLERLSGPLCDFVTDSAGGQGTLDELARTGVLISSVDADHAWFRYHPMLRAVARRRLRLEDGALEPLVLHRAAEWHLARGEVSEGVDYLIEAGAWDEVVQAAFVYGPAMFDEHRATEVERWIRRVPPSLRRRRARVLLLDAAVMVFGKGDPSELRGVFQDLDRIRRVSPAERVVADLLRAYLALADGAHLDAASAAERVLDGVGAVTDSDLPNLLGLTGSRVDVTAGALVAHAVAHMYDGRLGVARRDLERVAEECHGAWRASALGSLALVEAWSGNLVNAESLGARALTMADDLGHDGPSRTTAWLGLALVARERADFEEASAFLDKVHETGGTRRRVVAVWVAAERAHLALAAHRAGAGRTVLAGPRASMHPSMPDGILARRRVAEAAAFMALGDLNGAEEVLRLGFSAETSGVRSARVRLALEHGDAAAARALLEDWPDEPQPRADRERRLWLAVLDHLDGREAEACDAMAAVVGEADAEGDVGLFEEAGNFALGPARALYRSAPTAFLRTLVDRPITVRMPQPVRQLAEQLTYREYMVLVHLPTRQSNAEIAERLDVSLNTVKTHLKHIYRKLDVVGRSEAVDAAERLHLL